MTLALLLLLGCQEDVPFVEVSVVGLTADVRALEVGTYLAGRLATPQQVNHRLDRFIVQLPTGTTGALHLEVSGLAADGCAISRGTADVELIGPGRSLVEVTLALLPEKGCLLAVSMRGIGSGRVTSSPPGINCPERCQEWYPKGTVVRLTGVADASSYLYCARS